MNIRTCFLGTAAGLVWVSAAGAADAIVAAEPEPMDYVRVCDAYGEGHFFIPGTEICLKIAGYVRGEVYFGDPNGQDTFPGGGGDWLQSSSALLNPYFGSEMLRCGEKVHEFPPKGKL